jgi:hypothetical protein
MKSENGLMCIDGLKTPDTFIKAHLINYLRIHDFTIIEESKVRRKGRLTVVSKTGKKEIIEVWNGAHKSDKSINVAFTYSGINAESRTSFAEAWFGTLLSFGRYVFGERTTVAVGIPDTKDYRLMLEKLRCYFTENNISRKVYLVDGYGNISVLNLNQFIKTDN